MRNNVETYPLPPLLALSMRLIVAVPTPDAFDKSSWRHPRRARAARIWAGSIIETLRPILLDKS